MSAWEKRIERFMAKMGAKPQTVTVRANVRFRGIIPQSCQTYFHPFQPYTGRADLDPPRSPRPPSALLQSGRTSAHRQLRLGVGSGPCPLALKRTFPIRTPCAMCDLSHTDIASRLPLHLWCSLPDLVDQERFRPMPSFVVVATKIELT